MATVLKSGAAALIAVLTMGLAAAEARSATTVERQVRVTRGPAVEVDTAAIPDIDRALAGGNRLVVIERKAISRCCCAPRRLATHGFHSQYWRLHQSRGLFPGLLVGKHTG